MQQRPDSRRVRIAEILARGDQPQIAIIDQDRGSQASGQPVRKCLNLLDAHGSPSATSSTNPDQTRYVLFDRQVDRLSCGLLQAAKSAVRADS